MKILITIMRIVVGLLFIISGLIKANDPLGLAYKMDEYFAVWHTTWLSAYSLYLSIAMNVFEIVAGIAILIGFAPRLFTWLLLILIIFFSFLTGYAVLSGKIKTCGCFGDCIPLQAWQSFAKDLILLALIMLLFVKQALIKPFFSTRISLILILFFGGFFTFGQIQVLQHLPYLDCLPYAKEKNLLEQMQLPPGAKPDSVAVIYTYTKAGQDTSFDAFHFPDDFSDELYTNMRRENIVIRKGTGEAKIQDFALYTMAGEDTTQSILAQPNYYIFFFAKDFNGLQPAWQDMFVKIFFKARDKKVPLILVSNEPQKTDSHFNHTNHFGIPVLRLDGTVMKTMLRNKTGLVVMKGAEVMGKFAEKDMNNIIKMLNKW